MMRTKIKSYLNKTSGLYFLIAMILYVCSPFFFPMQKHLEYWMMKKHVQKRFETPIRILYFDENDINHLGGWPLPRNVYAYLIEQLNQLGVKAVGFDIFWEEAHTGNNENDFLLESILEKGYPVVGSFYFRSFDTHVPPYWKQLLGSSTDIESVNVKGPMLPSGPFLYSGADFGFINLPLEESGIVEKAVLQVSWGDTLLTSFASLLAQHDVDPLHSGKQIRINYDVPLEQMPFVPIRSLNSGVSQDSLSGLFRDSIVLVGVVSSQFGFNRATPVHSNMPVVAIHAQIVDNLIQNKSLKAMPAWIVFLFVLSLSCLAYLLKHQRLWIQLSVFIGLSLISLVLMDLSFQIHLIFPYSLVQVGIAVFWITSILVTMVSQQGLMNSEIAKREKLEMAFSKKVHQASQIEREYVNLRNKYQDEIQNIREELNHLPPEEKNRLKELFPNIICSSSGPMMQVLSEMNRVAKTDEPVLITGETGTGKDLVAKGIFEQSSRNDKEYIAINCGALSEQLLESELFGHEKGAFTGAMKTKPGFFEAADEGTIFLDEISETSLSFQAKLLRILQEGTFYRVGSTHPQQVNVRIIAATNRNLQELIQRGEFRQDLYFRLNVLPIELPALRERPSDIPLLLTHFLAGKELQITNEAMKLLQSYHWPGNIRELQNIAARIRVLPNKSLVTPQWLKRQGGLQPTDQNVNAELDDQILQLYRQFDFQNNSNVKIAEQLGHMHRSTITEYLKGMTFEFFFEEEFDLDRTVARFNPVADQAKDTRIKNRIRKYLANHIAKLNTKADFEENQSFIQDSMRKVPQKYHEVILHVSKAYLRGGWRL